MDEGTGINTYYGTIIRTSAAITYGLFKNIMPSAAIVGVRYIADNAGYNFDTAVFNLPKVVNGIGYVSCELNKLSGNVSITCTIQKVDKDSNVTNISSAVVSNTLSTNAECALIPLPLTQTHFGKGDKIRCVFAISDGSGSKIWCDPTGTDGTPLRVYIPFNLDL